MWNQPVFAKINDRINCPEVSCKKGVLKNFSKFTGKHLCQILVLKKLQSLACNFIKKEILTQAFSCEFCEISKNTFFYRNICGRLRLFWSEKEKLNRLSFFEKTLSKTQLRKKVGSNNLDTRILISGKNLSYNCVWQEDKK